MEDNKNAVVFIPKNAIMNVEISGDFLERCQSFLIGVCSSMSNEKLKQTFENYKDDKEPESIEEHAVFIMTPLIQAIELAAKEQSKTVTKTFTEEEIAELKKKL
jgi:hypothetical protein